MSIAELAKEAARESKMRRVVYPNSATPSPERKAIQLAAMDGIEALLKWIATQPDVVERAASAGLVEQPEADLFL